MQHRNEINEKETRRVCPRRRFNFGFTKKQNSFDMWTGSSIAFPRYFHIFFEFVCLGMEERHKNILRRNRTNLVRDLDPLNLYDGLLEKGVFTQDMIDEIKVREQCKHMLVVENLAEKCIIRILLLRLLSELRDQAWPGQAVGPGPGDPWESSLSFISGVPSGGGSARCGRTPTEWSSISSTTAFSNHSGCSSSCSASSTM